LYSLIEPFRAAVIDVGKDSIVVQVTVKRERIILEGDIPSPANPPSGCRFHTRCPFATDICKQTVPEFRNVGEEHFVACHHV
ncbi:oligopeptide/dipeptide ABC transporter ATP-binding protein, partial [Bacillus sp. D-CC]